MAGVHIQSSACPAGVYHEVEKAALSDTLKLKSSLRVHALFTYATAPLGVLLSTLARSQPAGNVYVPAPPAVGPEMLSKVSKKITCACNEEVEKIKAGTSNVNSFSYNSYL